MEKELFFKLFEDKVQSKLKLFCNKINTSKSDLYILMARKAACLVSAFEELNLVSLDGKVISERILDTKIDLSDVNSVTIVDDVVISGTTLNRTIKRLIELKPDLKINVVVIGVNKKWFNSDMLTDISGISYLEKPYTELEDSQCIKLSGDIVRALSVLPRPYSIDFPLYNTVRLNERQYEILCNLPEFEINETTSNLQYQNNTFTLTIRPDYYFLKSIYNTLPPELIKESLIKIRIYGKKNVTRKEVYSFSLVPMVILPPLSHSDIEGLFNHLVGSEINNVNEYLYNSTSKLRLIQFILADKLAYEFKHKLDLFSNKEIVLIRNRRTLHLLFSDNIIPVIYNIVKCKSDNVSPKINCDFKVKEFIANKNHHIDDNFISIITSLTKPFLSLYYKFEIKARQLAFKHGKNVFNIPEHKKVMNRLKMGFSLTDISHLLFQLPNEQIKLFVSSFLDRAIDNGIVVPITVDNNGLVYRAFRHGEDVQFGEREEKMCYEMLKSFSNSIQKEDLQKIWIEKLFVLFLKIGETNFLEPIQSETKNFNGINGKTKNSKSIASVKYYLQGPVVTKKNIRLGKKLDCNPCIDLGEKSDWLTKYFLLPEGILELSPKGMYQVSKTFSKEIIIEQKLISDSKKIGRIFGTLINNSLSGELPKINSDDFTALSCCSEPNDILGALAGEINITAKTWENSNPSTQVSFIPIREQIENCIANSRNHSRVAKKLRTNPIFRAINSGRQKFYWFLEKYPQKIIHEITSQWEDEIYQETWNGFWSPNLDWDYKSEERKKIDLIYVEGIWILCANLYFRILEFSLLSLASDSVSKSKLEKLNIEIKDYAEKINVYKNHSRTKEIIPFIQGFIDKKESVKYYSIEALKRIDSLVFASSSFLEDVVSFYESFKSFPKIQRFNNALFFDVESFPENINIQETILTTLSSIVFRMNKSEAKSNYIKKINEDDYPIVDSKGFWFVSSGSNSFFWLNQFISELIKKIEFKTNYKIFLFPNIPNECLYRTSNGMNSMAKNFWYFLSNFENLIQKAPYQLSVLNVVRDSMIKKEPNFGVTHILQSSTKMKVNIPYPTEFNIKKYVMNKNKMRKEFNIGILTIVTEEMQAALKEFNLDVENDVKIDGRSFYETEIELNNSKRKVVILQSTNQGNIPIVNAYNSLIKNYALDYIILLGIAGSIKTEIKLCDVVLGTQSIYYEKRKDTGQVEPSRRGEFFQISPLMTQVFNRFFVKHSEPAQLESSNGSKNDSFNVFRGPIGSGEAVIGNPNSEITKWLHTVQSKTCAVETEAAGFCQAFYEAELLGDNTVKDRLIIRGISDHADFDKDDKWRLPASRNAVKALLKLLELIYR